MGKMPKEQQMLVVGLILAIVGIYGYWTYLLSPTQQQIAERKVTLAGLNEKIEEAERQARRLPALQNELSGLQAELSTLEQQLPKDKDVPNIIRVLTREALQQNLQFVSLIPKDASRQQYFEIIPFDVQFIGTLHALGRFLASMGQQDRIFAAQNVSMTAQGGAQNEITGLVTLSIKLTLQTYAYAG